MKWNDVLDAYYGTRLTDGVVEVYELRLKEYNVSNTELCEIIRGASERKIKPSGYKAMLPDLICWIELSRSDWNEGIHERKVFL